MKRLKHPVFISIATFITSLACNAGELKPPQLTTGKQLYEYHCAACHQLDGKGNSQQGYPPINHTTLRSWQIRHKINGNESLGGKMPSFKDISKSKAKLISNYLKTLK